MRSNCISCTSGRKSVNRNEFSDIDSMWRGTFRRSTLLFVYCGDFSLRMRSFRHITTSGQMKRQSVFL